jgi:hypothetical protein
MKTALVSSTHGWGGYEKAQQLQLSACGSKLADFTNCFESVEH